MNSCAHQLFSAAHQDSPKSTRGHFKLVDLICVCSFTTGYLLFILHCSRGKNNNHYFNVVVSINKLSNISHASLKSYLSDVRAARQGLDP